MLLGIPGAAGETNEGEDACRGFQNVEGLCGLSQMTVEILVRHEFRAINKSGTIMHPAF